MTHKIPSKSENFGIVKTERDIKSRYKLLPATEIFFAVRNTRISMALSIIKSKKYYSCNRIKCKLTSFCVYLFSSCCVPCTVDICSFGIVGKQYFSRKNYLK